MAESREHGFTLIELVVGLVLATIVMALLVGAIIDMFGSSERSAMDNKAQRAAALAADTLTSDLRAMRAPEREPRFTGSPDSLRTMLLDGDNPNGYEIHDLLVASPTQVMFYAELINTAGNTTVECVTWFVRPADQALIREVRAWSANCGGVTPTRGGGGAVLQQQEIMPAPERDRASAAAKVPEPFRYRLQQVADPADPDPTTCTTPAPTAGPLASALRRDQVTNVLMDLRSFVAGRVASGDQQLQSSATITARQSMEYRYAIGCAS
jgi:prepilin-type N-terminal cleavage/methylation domain-containing protein